ncbi:hypothetical protein MYSEV_136 [Mythimna separata entomopoxvirus 'L']|uniref:Uncharacterized protein n=1 Tax=Mythimna separata entomopoxvirus 'L' TaxID=1293572 RepID=A0A916NYJ0_9POXV|nr:hypothetical protein MYSEV_136 [Mythimna separata entomopoxvirus 'L']CCU56334.1 hypothetical protein MYSEV_136 [Mythimna separata entomopoxvirus 'L']
MLSIYNYILYPKMTNIMDKINELNIIPNIIINNSLKCIISLIFINSKYILTCVRETDNNILINILMHSIYSFKIILSKKIRFCEYINILLELQPHINNDIIINLSNVFDIDSLIDIIEDNISFDYKPYKF